VFSAMRSRMRKDKKQKDIFPILDLPGELSSKILSYMGRKELGVCLQSFPLDILYAEWNKDQIIERIEIEIEEKMPEMASERYNIRWEDCCSSSIRHLSYRFRHVFEKCKIGDLIFNVSAKMEDPLYHELIQICMEIRCTNFIIKSWAGFSFSTNFDDKTLRSLISHKSNVQVDILSDKITAAGIFAVWEDLLDGKFDGFSILLDKTVIIEVFKLLRTDGNTNSLKYSFLPEIISEGRLNKTSNYEIWCYFDYDRRFYLRMSRIFDGQKWKKTLYEAYGIYAKCNHSLAQIPSNFFK
ncbi:hypothetical protein PFISCL1PPCAC_21257, partial [Pristionchus fissidentatus]